MGLFNKLFGDKQDEEKQSSEALALEEKQDMIKGIEDLSETSVKEVMIPRIDVDFLSLGTPQEELLEKIAESGHSRFPVYSESIDNVVGVLYVKDLINAFSKKETIDLEKIIRKPFYVPESKRIDTLLREFKRRHVHIAIAIDEYGGISGIICMEDIIEQIVGDIQDEFDNEQEDIIAVGENLWLCDARVNIDDLNEKIETSIPNEEFDTLGGFVFDLFGKIPAKFEKASWNGLDFIVQDMEGHRINQIKILKRNDEIE
ncbi:MAG: HlyC/CorC family transporter [Spirochaetaceae bacterium]|nr:HlyC/CorC family transporter [Spirochaetaceae bacterium]MBQ4555444.1 HlyC/CorC family transporter [Spirochaetaceae bacterium]